MAAHDSAKLKSLPGFRKTITAYLHKPRSDDIPASPAKVVQEVKATPEQVDLENHNVEVSHDDHTDHVDSAQCTGTAFVTNGMTPPLKKLDQGLFPSILRHLLLLMVMMDVWTWGGLQTMWVWLVCQR